MMSEKTENSVNQQVDRKNIFVRVWRILREFASCRQRGEQTDGANACSRARRCFFGFIRRLFVRSAPQPADEQKPKEDKILIPRVRLTTKNHFEYEMQNECRGIALIFNHEIFGMRDKGKRLGSIRDRDRLKENLERLHFEVHCLDDFTLHEIKEKLGKVSVMDFTHHDCLLITFMTHGDERTISAYDRDYSLDLVTKYFTDARCPTLKGKPRLFFIQACRGNKVDDGLTPEQHDEHLQELERKRDERRRRRKGHDHVDATPDEHEREVEQMLHNPPIYKDFLIVRSAMPGFYSYRNIDYGSWFIQDLCNELEEEGASDNFLHILTRVNNRVSRRESRATFLNGKKQILCISSMLTKILILDKKNYEEELIFNKRSEEDKVNQNVIPY